MHFAPADERLANPGCSRRKTASRPVALQDVSNPQPFETKPILCPERLRHAPRQFSWIDQRLVRDRHIQGRSPDVPPALPASAAPPRAGEILSAADILRAILEGGTQMIDYETYCRIRLFHQERGLNASQIGRELGIAPETAAKYATLDNYPRRRATKRASKLDAFKPAIIRWLEHHPYSAKKSRSPSRTPSSPKPNHPTFTPPPASILSLLSFSS